MMVVGQIQTEIDFDVDDDDNDGGDDGKGCIDCGCKKEIGCV